MVDLNNILLFIAVASPLVIIAGGWRPGGIYRGWRIAAGIVLAVTAVAWLLFRREAGYIGGTAWLALLFLPAIGLKRMSELFAMQQYTSARRLATTLRWLHPSTELRQQIQLLRTFEARQSAGRVRSSGAPEVPAAKDRARDFRKTPIVFVIILLNAAAFGVELLVGSWSDVDVLHRLGALEFYAVVYQHEYWRLLTALFLHYDITHLLFNVFALYVLGPPLERAVGGVRFLICYLVSGLGSTAGVLALTFVGLVHAGQLIGASGSVMGIVGAWAGYLIRHRHTPMAKRRLSNILMIVVIQTIFDLITPQVSMAAHLCGLASGFILGLIISPKTRSLRPQTEHDYDRPPLPTVPRKGNGSSFG